MTPDFKAYVIDLESQKNCSHMRYYQTTAEEMEAYSERNVSVIDEIFRWVIGDEENRAQNLQPNLIRLLGDAGVGKTTLVQRLTWLWANGKNELSTAYNLFFFIPIRKVKEGTLMEILSHLILLPPSKNASRKKTVLDRLYEYLSRPENAKHTIFILDGADENDIRGELHKLIEGQLFAGSTVLMTARPEAKCLKSFSQLPKVKVSLSGTDDNTVKKYMKEAVCAQNEEERNEYEQNYKEILSNSKLLRIPLYLTLLCFVFKADIAKGMKCTQLRIPQTMTALFNAFMHVLISRWMNRIDVEPTVIEFKNSPLGSDSTVPAHIQRTIRAIGELCLKDLLSENSLYEFTKAHASKCFLDMDDIVACGFFTVAKTESAEIFFPIHKQIQEYLAGVYLAHEGISQPSFHKLLNGTHNQGKSLSQVMRDHNMIKLVQFTCGLSSDFCNQLLEFAASHFCIMKCIYDGSIDIYYETVLFTECNIEHLPNCIVRAVKVFTDFLCKTNVKCFDDNKFYFLFHKDEEYGYCHKCLHKVASAFNQEIAVELLSRLYKIKLKPVINGQSACYYLDANGGDTSNSALELCLDQLQTELLSYVYVQDVGSVSVGNRKSVAYVDLPRVLTTFSNINKISVHCESYIPYTSNGHPNGEMSREMTSVELNSTRVYGFPKDHVECILKQEMLAHLKIGSSDILHAMSSEVQKTCWAHLKTFDVNYFTKLTVPEVFAICSILESSSHTLHTLETVRFSETHLDNKLLQAMRQLNIIERLSISYRNLSGAMAEKLTKCLLEMKNIKALECRALFDGKLNSVCDVLLSLKQLTELTVHVDKGTLEMLSSCLPHMRQLLILRIVKNREPNEELVPDDQFSTAVKSLENLECFDVNCDNILVCLAGMQKLQKLSTSITFCEDYDLYSQLCLALQSLTNLRLLSINFIDMSHAKNEFLSDCLPSLVKLENLSLRNVYVREEMVLRLSKALKSLPKLTHLHVVGSGLESSCMDKVLADCLPHMSSHIHALELCGITVHQTVFHQFCKAVKSLENLKYLSYSFTTENFAVPVITDCVPYLPGLEFLSLLYCYSENSLPEICDALCQSSLRTLYMCGQKFPRCKYPTDFMHRLYERGIKVSKYDGQDTLLFSKILYCHQMAV